MATEERELCNKHELQLLPDRKSERWLKVDVRSAATKMIFRSAASRQPLRAFAPALSPSLDFIFFSPFYAFRDNVVYGRFTPETITL